MKVASFYTKLLEQIFHSSLEHGITSLDVHFPQQLSHLLLLFPLLPMFHLKDMNGQSCLDNLEKLLGCPCPFPRWCREHIQCIQHGARGWRTDWFCRIQWWHRRWRTWKINRCIKRLCWLKWLLSRRGKERSMTIENQLLMIKVEHELIWVHNICRRYGGQSCQTYTTFILCCPFWVHDTTKKGCQVNRMTHQEFDSSCKYGLLKSNFEAVKILTWQFIPIAKRSILSSQLFTGTISLVPKNFVTLWWWLSDSHHMHYALCTSYPCVPWWFQCKCYAIRELCMIISCIMRKPTVVLCSFVHRYSS